MGHGRDGAPRAAKSVQDGHWHWKGLQRGRRTRCDSCTAQLGWRNGDWSVVRQQRHCSASRNPSLQRTDCSMQSTQMSVSAVTSLGPLSSTEHMYRIPRNPNCPHCAVAVGIFIIILQLFIPLRPSLLPIVLAPSPGPWPPAPFSSRALVEERGGLP